MYGCVHCGGVLLAQACAQKLASALPEEAIRWSQARAVEAKSAGSTDPWLVCPLCQRTMTRLRAEKAGVDLDVCDRHGTFYDKHEIERVTAAIKSTNWGKPLAIAGGVAAASAVAVAASQSPYRPAAVVVPDAVASTAQEVAVEIGVEAALEGVFSVIGALFEAS